MMLGRVIGEVWASQKHAGLNGRKLMLVAGVQQSSVGLSPSGEVVVAVDDIGARPGHLVTVSWGSGARAVLAPPDNRSILADAAISRIVDAQTEAFDGRETVIVEE
jgi:ethanolamine utilization protein EutN